MKKSLIKKIKAISCGLLAAALVITAVPMTVFAAGNANKQFFQDNSSLMLVGETDRIRVEAGQTYTITQEFGLANGTPMYTSPKFTFISDDGMFSFDNITVSQKDPSQMTSAGLVTFKNQNRVLVTYDITVSPFAKVGELKYGVRAESTNVITFDEYRNPIYGNTGTFYLKADVIGELTEPTFVLDSDPDFKAVSGDYIDIVLSLKNLGEMDAFDTYVTLGSNEYFIPMGTMLKQKIGIVERGETTYVSYRFKIDSDARAGRVALPISVSCKNLRGESISDSAGTVFVTILNDAATSAMTSEASITVSDIRQLDPKPEAGKQMEVSFTLTNNGNVAFENLTLSINGVSSSGFEPVSSDPYFRVGSLKTGESKTVTVPVMVGKYISSGIRSLEFDVQADKVTGGEYNDTVRMYILDVVSSGDTQGVSKPKLMVTDFETSISPVTAGSTFTFSFTLKNTNEETFAKNIKVKVTSSDFSVVAGGNSFFVNEIKPGETASIDIDLKAMSALTTGAYPITISTEYEYDGMPSSENGGVSTHDELLIQVNEVLRASCENISIGGWETPSLGNPTSLNFEFYNMGRSRLSNVYITVEGDFALATGQSYYIGNIEAGYPEYVDCSVLPLVSGEAECIITIHMEDSNGEEQIHTAFSTSYVSENSDGMGDPFGDIVIPGGDIDYPDYDDLYEDKDDLFPTAMVCGIAGGVVALIVIIIIVCRVVAKKKKDDDDEFDD